MTGNDSRKPDRDKSALTGEADSQKKTVAGSSETSDISGRIGGGMLVLLWILLLAGGTWLAQRWLDDRYSPEWSTDTSGKHELILRSDRYGQYHITGSANGQDVNFLLDTGASDVSLPQAVADRLGLERGMPSRVITANGTITVFATQLEELRIGPFAKKQVRAHINPHMHGNVALLGMSYLQHFELRQRGGTLTISRP